MVREQETDKPDEKKQATQIIEVLITMELLNNKINHIIGVLEDFKLRFEELKAKR